MAGLRMALLALARTGPAALDSFNDVVLHASDREGEWFSKMKELFEIARRTALGSEKILNEILSELDIPF